MQIETRSILNFIKEQKKITESQKFIYDEKTGMISGLNFVKDYIELYEKQEGEAIAKELDNGI